MDKKTWMSHTSQESGWRACYFDQDLFFYFRSISTMFILFPLPREIYASSSLSTTCYLDSLGLWIVEWEKPYVPRIFYLK